MTRLKKKAFFAWLRANEDKDQKPSAIRSRTCPIAAHLKEELGFDKGVRVGFTTFGVKSTQYRLPNWARQVVCVSDSVGNITYGQLISELRKHGIRK